MRETVLDTDMLSELLKGKNKHVAENAHRYEQQHGNFTTTSVTVTEITKGLRKKGGDEAIAKFHHVLDSMTVLPLDRSAAIIAGEIYSVLEVKGLPIGRADPMIAGIALSNAFALATGNTKHFQRIVDAGYALELVNWREL